MPVVYVVSIGEDGISAGAQADVASTLRDEIDVRFADERERGDRRRRGSAAGRRRWRAPPARRRARGTGASVGGDRDLLRRHRPDAARCSRSIPSRPVGPRRLTAGVAVTATSVVPLDAPLNRPTPTTPRVGAGRGRRRGLVEGGRRRSGGLHRRGELGGSGGVPASSDVAASRRSARAASASTAWRRRGRDRRRSPTRPPPSPACSAGSRAASCSMRRRARPMALKGSSAPIWRSSRTLRR